MTFEMGLVTSDPRISQILNGDRGKCLGSCRQASGFGREGIAGKSRNNQGVCCCWQPNVLRQRMSGMLRNADRLMRGAQF